MKEVRSSVTVRIDGQEHTIRANAEPAYTKKCARLVDERIHEIRSKSGLIDGHKAAILAALSLADEYFQAVEEAEKNRREVVSRTTNLTRRLEAELSGSGGPGWRPAGERRTGRAAARRRRRQRNPTARAGFSRFPGHALAFREGQIPLSPAPRASVTVFADIRRLSSIRPPG